MKRICNCQRLTFRVSCALEAELLVPFTDKRAKRDKHNVGQNKQQMVKKGSDGVSDIWCEEDSSLDSQEEDQISDSSACLDGEVF